MSGRGKGGYGPSVRGEVRGDKQLPPKGGISRPPSDRRFAKARKRDTHVSSGGDYGPECNEQLRLLNQYYQNRESGKYLRDCQRELGVKKRLITALEDTVNRYKRGEIKPDEPDDGSNCDVEKAIAGAGGIATVLGTLFGVVLGGGLGIGLDGSIHALEPGQIRWEDDDYIDPEGPMPEEPRSIYEKIKEEIMKWVEEQVKIKARECGVDQYPAINRIKLTICLYKVFQKFKDALEKDKDECNCHGEGDALKPGDPLKPPGDETDPPRNTTLVYQQERSSCYVRKWRKVRGRWVRRYEEIPCSEVKPW